VFSELARACTPDDLEVRVWKLCASTALADRHCVGVKSTIGLASYRATIARAWLRDD
jgi:hypothetical protein